MVFVIRNGLAGNLYSVCNSDLSRSRPLLLAFKRKDDAKSILNLVESMVDLNNKVRESRVKNTHHPWLLSSFVKFVNEKRYSKKISVESVSYRNLLRRCSMNCVDVMLIEDSNGSYELIDLQSIIDQDDYVFHLENMIKYL